VTYADDNQSDGSLITTEEGSDFGMLTVAELQRQIKRAKTEHAKEMNSFFDENTNAQNNWGAASDARREEESSSESSLPQKGDSSPPERVPEFHVIGSTGALEDNAEMVSELSQEVDYPEESSSSHVQNEGHTAEGPEITLSQRIIAAQEIELQLIRNTKHTDTDGEPSHLSTNTELMQTIEKLQQKVTLMQTSQSQLQHKIQVRDTELQKQKLTLNCRNRWHGEACRIMFDISQSSTWPIIAVALLYGGLIFLFSTTIEVWNSDHGSLRDLDVGLGIPFAFFWALALFLVFTAFLIAPFYIYSSRFWEDHNFIWWRYEGVRSFIFCIYSGYIIALCCIHRSAFLIAPYNQSSFCSIDHSYMRLLCKSGEYLLTPIHQTYKYVTDERPLLFQDLLSGETNFSSAPHRVFHRNVDAPFLESGRSRAVIMSNSLNMTIRDYIIPPHLNVTYALRKYCRSPCHICFEGLDPLSAPYEVLVSRMEGEIKTNHRTCEVSNAIHPLTSCGLFGHDRNAINVTVEFRDLNETEVKVHIRAEYEVHNAYDGHVLARHACAGSYDLQFNDVSRSKCIELCMQNNCAVAAYIHHIGACVMNSTNACHFETSNGTDLFLRTPKASFSRDTTFSFDYICTNEVFDYSYVGVNESWIELEDNLESCLECTQRCSRLRGCVGVVCDLGTPCIFIPRDTKLVKQIVPFGESMKTCFKRLHSSASACDSEDGTWCGYFCGDKNNQGIGPDCMAEVATTSAEESQARASECVGVYIDEDFAFNINSENVCGDFCHTMGVPFYVFNEYANKCACKQHCAEILTWPSNLTNYHFMGRGKCSTSLLNGQQSNVNHYEVRFHEDFRCRFLCDSFIFCVGYHARGEDLCLIYAHFDDIGQHLVLLQSADGVSHAQFFGFSDTGYIDSIHDHVSGEECWKKGGPEDGRQWEYVNHWMDPAAIVSVNSGAFLHEIQESLLEHELTLLGVPSLPEISALEAINTGMWGKDFSMLSSYVFALTVLKADGVLEYISNGDSRLEAFRLDLGLLGIIKNIEFVAFPLFYVKKHSERKKDFDIEGFLKQDVNSVNRQIKIKNFGESKKAVLEWHEISAKGKDPLKISKEEAWEGYRGGGMFWYYGILPLYLIAGQSFFTRMLISPFFATRPSTLADVIPFSRSNIWETELIGVRYLEYFLHIANCEAAFSFIWDIMDRDSNIRALEFIISKPRVIDNTLLGFNNAGPEVCSISAQYMITGDFWRAQYTLEEITSHVMHLGGLCAWYRQCYGLDSVDSLSRVSSTFARHVLDLDHHGQFFNEFYASILNLYTSYPGLGLECSRYQYIGNYDEECETAGEDCGVSADGIDKHCISVYNYGTLHCGACSEFYRFSTEGTWSPVEHAGSSAWKDVDSTLENGLSLCRTVSQLFVFVVVLFVIASLSCCLTIDPEEDTSCSITRSRDHMRDEDEIEFFE